MKNRLPGYRTIGRGAATILAMLALVLTLSSMNAAAAGVGDKGNRPASPALTQYFQDIPTSNFFYQFTADLYNTGVVSGYTCGVAPAGPCVPPDNLPYYVPNNNVTRGLMAIYIDNARTKPLHITTLNGISPAVEGQTTYTSGIALEGYSTANGTANNYANETQAVLGYATGDYSAGVFGYGSDTATNSIGVRGFSSSSYGGYFTSTTGIGGYFDSDSNDGLDSYSNSYYGGNFSSTSNDAADFHGNQWGIYVRNAGPQPAVDAASSGANSYAGIFYSAAFRAGYFKSGDNGQYSLFVDTQDGPTQGTAGLEVNGSIRGEGNLYIAGSKAGYVVDEMQNADSVALEPGDVVVIAGDSTAPVLGQIPVPSVKLAAIANDSAVVGIVDEPLYVPDAATKAAYDAQQQADREAAAAAAAQSASEMSSKQKLSPMADIKNRISDAAGTLHADHSVTSVAPGKYVSVVTLGAYKAVKVDASFGPVHAGDLLTTSPHAGYAMVVKDKAAAYGAVIGKALSGLDSGTGTVTVMVSLK